MHLHPRGPPRCQVPGVPQRSPGPAPPLSVQGLSCSLAFYPCGWGSPGVSGKEGGPTCPGPGHFRRLRSPWTMTLATLSLTREAEQRAQGSRSLGP